MSARWLLLLASACYAPSPDDCQYFCADTDNEADKCPSGLVCLDGECRTPGATGKCTADPALCGNGRRDPGEPCDDSNDNVNDSCIACQPAKCGDGHVFAGVEACDDGNASETDNCGNDCEWARCGDGKLRAGVEECEDPGVGDCTHQCLRCPADLEFLAYAGSLDGHCYKRSVTMTVTQPMAKTTCEMMGGHIVTVDDETQRAELGAMLLSSTFWIGLHKPGGVTREWITGEPVGTFANVVDGPGLCFRQNGGGVQWEATACAGSERVTCEIDGWHIDTQQPIADNHAYRVVFTEKSWQDAKAECEILPGGHLATLVDARSQVFLAGKRFLDTWIGARRTSGDAFEWVNGDPFGYTSWANGGPGPEGCVMMSGPSGQWRTADCAAPKPFVCEID